MGLVDSDSLIYMGEIQDMRMAMGNAGFWCVCMYL